MTQINAALAEYDLTDEIRRVLPLADAERLARAALSATDMAVTVEQLERISEDDWYELFNGVQTCFYDDAARALVRAGDLLDAIKDEKSRREILQSFASEEIANHLRESYDQDDLEEIASLLDDKTRAAFAKPAEAPEEVKEAKTETPALRLFFVYQTLPKARRARARKVFRYVAIAPTPEEAVTKVRGDQPTPLHRCEWRAEEIQNYAAIDWTTEP